MHKFEEYLSPEIVRKDLLSEELLTKEQSNYGHLVDQIKNKIDRNEPLGEEVIRVRKDIIDSWIRSSNYKVDINDFSSSVIHLAKYEFDEITQKNERFIIAANSILQPLEEIFISTNCLAFLTDHNGVILEAINGDNNIKQQHLMVKGAIWREDTVGTCAHGVCLEKEYPVQIWGPEHWCSLFRYSTGSAAPIFDSNHSLVGTLTIGSQSGNPQGIHTLALAISLTSAIQNKYQLLTQSDFFDKALDTNENAIILIDSKGIIIQCNARALQLPLYGEELIGRKYDSVFGKQQAISEAIYEKKEKSNNELVSKNTNCKFLYSVKPLQSNMGCIMTIEEEKSRLQNISCTNSKTPQKSSFEKIIGNSPEIKKTISLAQNFANSDTSILIMGESGVGKDLFAQAIHYTNHTSEPFIAVNCAAIPRNLFESELFGYEGGTFTGADRGGRSGKIELAHKGTLFLDEIGDMPLEVQPILLRVLEDKQVMRLGSNKYIPVDFRLIAATNQNLRELVSEGKFRLDLYYRIAVFSIIIPPLRERKPDIFLLAEYFISQIAQKLNISPPCLSPAAKIKMENFSWPGNIRQLQNAMIYSVHMARNSIIDLEHLPFEIIQSFPDKDSNNDPKDTVSSSSTLEGIQKMTISDALKLNKNNVRKTAEMLGMSKSTLYRKIKEYRLM